MNAPMKMIPIEQADRDQLKEFAETYLGMNFPNNTKEETMRAKVKAAWSKPEIPVADREAQAEAAQAEVEGQQGTPPPPVTAEQQRQPDKVRVIIARTDEAGGDEPVPVGVNGRVMLVPRGEEVDIPPSYYEALQHAVKNIYERDDQGNLVPEPRKVPAYPIQRIA